MSENLPTVLVVDDEIQIRRFLRTGFELNGFAVHEASTGTEAISMTKKAGPSAASAKDRSRPQTSQRSFNEMKLLKIEP